MFSKIGKMGQIIDREKTSVVTEKMLYWLGYGLVEKVGRRFFSLDIVKDSSLPAGPKILASNHPTTMDPFLMLTLVPEQLCILVAGELFSIPLFGRYLRAAGHIPVERTNGKSTLEKAQQLLRKGTSIGIYPEGSLSPRVGRKIDMARPHTGAVRLAMATGAPIIPVGTYLPPENIRFFNGTSGGKSWVGRYTMGGAYAITIGDPIWLTGDIEDRSEVRRLGKTVMTQIGSLAWQSQQRLENSRTFNHVPEVRPADLTRLAQSTPE